jgi:hypothetical protein
MKKEKLTERPKESENGDQTTAELEAEQESAAAMDADVPQPQEEDEMTEGQLS